MKNFKSNGLLMVWTNDTGVAVTSGSVVAVGSIIGVAEHDIAIGTTGNLVTDGVVELPKATGVAMAQGEEIIWDASAGVFQNSAHAPATGDVSKACIADQAAGTAAETVMVSLAKRIGTVAA